MKLLLSLIFTATLLFSMSKHQNKIDDWDENATNPKEQLDTSGAIQPTNMSAPMVKMKAMKMSLGLSVGGAKDANNFYENLKNNYLPKLESITYEGVFYDHYFKQKEQNCKELFCPNFETAIRDEMFSGKKEHFLSVGLSSNLDSTTFKRKKLNLVVVLDISGSMSSPFDRYYYDGKNNDHEESEKSKMEIANHSIASMIDHLAGHDSFGVVLFDNNSYLAKPLREVAKTDMKAIKGHILDLRSKGGTNWSAGYKSGLKLFDGVEKKLRSRKPHHLYN